MFFFSTRFRAFKNRRVKNVTADYHKLIDKRKPSSSSQRLSSDEILFSVCAAALRFDLEVGITRGHDTASDVCTPTYTDSRAR